MRWLLPLLALTLAVGSLLLFPCTIVATHAYRLAHFPMPFRNPPVVLRGVLA